jgi:hypothetical protein
VVALVAEDITEVVAVLVDIPEVVGVLLLEAFIDVVAVVVEDTT